MTEQVFRMKERLIEIDSTLNNFLKTVLIKMKTLNLILKTQLYESELYTFIKNCKGEKHEKAIFHGVMSKNVSQQDIEYEFKYKYKNKEKNESVNYRENVLLNIKSKDENFQLYL